MSNNQAENPKQLNAPIAQRRKGIAAQRQPSVATAVLTSDGNPGPGLVPSKAAGRFQSFLVKLFARSATVASVQVLTNRFRLITLAGATLKKAAWRPGQKVQVQLGNFVSRTYTPITWDRSEGTTRLLAFIHGDGPGAAWAASLNRGDKCQIFGPRRSLDLTAVPRPAVFFGDETSIGLAHALHATADGMRDVAFLFEVSSTAETQRALEALGIPGATLIERGGGDAHLHAAEAWIARVAAKHTLEQYIFSGNARSIQHLTRTLRRGGISSSRLKVKAYWAPDKTGLD